MTMKKMKNFMALLLALVMTMSLMACGNKTDEETKTERISAVTCRPPSPVRRFWWTRTATP